MDDNFNMKDGFPDNPSPGEFSENQIPDNNAFFIENDFDFSHQGDEIRYEKQAKQNPGKHRKDKKNKRNHGIVKTVIWIASILIISVGIAFGIIFLGADYMGIGFGRGEDCIIEIEQGMGTKQIAEKLKESGAVKCPVLFRLYAKFKNYDSQFKYGVYTFNNEAGYSLLAEMLMKDGAKSDSVHVTIPEMSSVDDIAEILENAGVCNKDDFIDAVQNGDFNYDFINAIPYDSVYYRLEGYLFPDTYDFYCYDSKECAHLAIDKMLMNLDKKIDSDLKEKIASGGRIFHEYMTMASLVELESGGAPNEMANVAEIFYNRLNNSAEFPTLGSSPTRKYPHGDGRYNTYLSKGLPPGPLCSPSLNSIKAAITPSTEYEGYYYFVTDAAMKFYYNKTQKEHDSTIAKLKAENNWIYED